MVEADMALLFNIHFILGQGYTYNAKRKWSTSVLVAAIWYAQNDEGTTPAFNAPPPTSKDSGNQKPVKKSKKDDIKINVTPVNTTVSK